MNTPQFDLGAMLSAPAQTAVRQIPCEQIHPYHDHKFELYTGERLEDMVASIKENGVLSPIIVQPDGDGYEILIGHNRWNASKLAGKQTVPAIIKTGLTEDEAFLYTVESNLIQRGFENLRISEQAASSPFVTAKCSRRARETILSESLPTLNTPTSQLLTQWGRNRARRKIPRGI